MSQPDDQIGKLYFYEPLADVEELLRIGVEPSIRNEDGETALDLAESLGLVKVIERLRSRAG